MSLYVSPLAQQANPDTNNKTNNNTNTDKLMICETCVRDRRLAPGEASLGRQLADAVSEKLATAGLAIELRVVSCLSGCLHPANVALRCRGKFGLRFSELGVDDADALLRLAKLYATSEDGAIDNVLLPAGFATKLSAKIPPVGVAAGVGR